MALAVGVSMHPNVCEYLEEFLSRIRAGQLILDACEVTKGFSDEGFLSEEVLLSCIVCREPDCEIQYEDKTVEADTNLFRQCLEVIRAYQTRSAELFEMGLRGFPDAEQVNAMIEQLKEKVETTT